MSFLHVGENNLGRMPTGHIATELTDLVTELANLSHSRVANVSQLICFPTTAHLYPGSVQHINSTLWCHLPAGHRKSHLGSIVNCAADSV